jgi:hypothetical protein
VYWQSLGHRFGFVFSVSPCRQHALHQLTRYFTQRGAVAPLAAQAVNGVDKERRGHACAVLRPAPARR